MTAPKTGSWLSGPVLPGLFLLVMLAVLLTNAWVVDDAYITFRTVDNFIHGHGLTWNIDERVQVYTHPLWMFVMSFFYFITRELFFTTIVLSAALSLLAFGLVYRMVTRDAPDALWRGGLLVLALLSSKAVMDYASSGLENCLTYVLMALFMVRLKALDPASARAPRSLLLLFLLATFSGLNRLDTILMYGPALLYALYRCRGLGVRRLLAVAGLGVLPLVLWTLFSLIYYGQPFPNTAYAKVLSVEYPASWKFRRGLAYLGNSISWDSASFVLLLLAVGLAARRRDRLGLAMLSGVLLYILFTVVSAASATHMSGRFFAVPYFVAIGLAVALLPGKRSLQALCGVLAVFLLVNPVSSIKFGTPLYRPYQQHVSTIDTKWYCWRDGAALLKLAARQDHARPRVVPLRGHPAPGDGQGGAGRFPRGRGHRLRGVHGGAGHSHGGPGGAERSPAGPPAGLPARPLRGLEVRPFPPAHPHGLHGVAGVGSQPDQRPPDPRVLRPCAIDHPRAHLEPPPLRHHHRHEPGPLRRPAGRGPGRDQGPSPMR